MTAKLANVKTDASNTAADGSAISEIRCVIYIRICVALLAEDKLGRILNNFALSRGVHLLADVKPFRLETITPIIIVRKSEVDRADGKAVVCQASLKVFSILAPVTGIHRIRETIFTCGCRGTHRNRNNQVPAAGTQNAMQLPDRSAVIIDVFQNVMTPDQVNGV